MRTELSQKALAGASKNAEKAFHAFSDQKFEHVPASERAAWAVATVIHCDFCRLVIAYEECEREGIARMLWMADISSKLFEARNWYSNPGTKLLRAIDAKQCEVSVVNKEIEQLEITYQIPRVNKYEDYRNKLGYHYDSLKSWSRSLSFPANGRNSRTSSKPMRLSHSMRTCHCNDLAFGSR